MRSHTYVKASDLKKGEVVLSSDNSRWTIISISDEYRRVGGYNTPTGRLRIIGKNGNKEQTWTFKKSDQVRRAS